MVSSGDCYGCSVDVQGRLVVYKNEEELGVAWEGLPTDQPLWAFTDVLDNRLTVDYHLAMEGKLALNVYFYFKVEFEGQQFLIHWLKTFSLNLTILFNICMIKEI